MVGCCTSLLFFALAVKVVLKQAIRIHLVKVTSCLVFKQKIIEKRPKELDAISYLSEETWFAQLQLHFHQASGALQAVSKASNMKAVSMEVA